MNSFLYSANNINKRVIRISTIGVSGGSIKPVLQIDLAYIAMNNSMPSETREQCIS